MRLVYIDDVKEGAAYFAGIMIDAGAWRSCADAWQAMLAQLAATYGFRTTREIHATKLLGGHGHFFDERPTRDVCLGVHRDIVRCIASFPTVKIFLSCGPHALEMRAFERLITRVDRTVQAENDLAMLICDEGKTYDDLLNALRKNNPIVHRDYVGNRPLRFIVEDIVYRSSKRSFMVQAADAVVYTLFRKEDPLERLEEIGFADVFPMLGPVIARESAPNDPHGIIRC